MEHRWGRRISLDIAVRLGLCAGVVDGRLTNVSLSGAYVKTNTPVLPLTPTYLQLKGECSSGAAARAIQAWIIRVDAGGVGLEWADFSPPAIRELLNGEIAHSAPGNTAENAGPTRAKLTGGTRR